MPISGAFDTSKWIWMPWVTGAGVVEPASGVAGKILPIGNLRISELGKSLVYSWPRPSAVMVGIDELVPVTPMVAMIAGQPSPSGSVSLGPCVHGLLALP